RADRCLDPCRAAGRDPAVAKEAAREHRDATECGVALPGERFPPAYARRGGGTLQERIGGRDPGADQLVELRIVRVGCTQHARLELGELAVRAVEALSRGPGADPRTTRVRVRTRIAVVARAGVRRVRTAAVRRASVVGARIVVLARPARAGDARTVDTLV